MSDASAEAQFSTSVDWSKVTFGQRETIEVEYGQPYREWGADIESDSPTARAQLLLIWLAGNQRDRSFTLTQARDVEIGRIVVERDRAGDAADPTSGDPPASSES